MTICHFLFSRYPSELFRLKLENNAFTPEFPNGLFTNFISIVVFLSLSLFILSLAALRSNGFQLLILEVNILFLYFILIIFINKAEKWVELLVNVSETVYVIEETVRRDRRRYSSATSYAEGRGVSPSTTTYKKPVEQRQTVLKKRQPIHSSNTMLAKNGKEQPFEISLDVGKLDAALKNGVLWG